MTNEQALIKLKEYNERMFALNVIGSTIYYDAETAAPAGAAEGRGEAFAYLSGLEYELTTSEDIVEMLEYLHENADSFEPQLKRESEELYKSYDKIRKIPKDEYIEFVKLTNESNAVWHKAKIQNDYKSFEPYLQKMFDTMRKFAGYYSSGIDPYDALLDQYERGLTREKCDAFFNPLRERIVPLINKIAQKPQIDDSPLYFNFPVTEQRELSKLLMEFLQIDPERCIIGEAEHPFTLNPSKDDVRITTHYYPDNFTSSMYSVIHEGGHALYELHTGDQYRKTCLAGGVSMAIHESQSRFYENIIGRSREFCEYIFSMLKKYFKGYSPEDFYKMINRSQPSLIRVEADELTYCLHIMVRYQLEKEMIDGVITAAELPERWNTLYREYLGIEVPDDKNGVLQDSHWANGNIGYFPSYAIGSAYGVQLLRVMSGEIDVSASVKNGDLSPVNKWLEEKIWQHGCMYDPGELFEKVCGKFNPDYYMKYLEEKMTEVYNL